MSTSLGMFIIKIDAFVDREVLMARERALNVQKVTV